MKTKSLILCALFSALLAVSAMIKIPFPYLPFTLQTFFVLLSGMLLGGKGGAASVLVYLSVGLCGLPVFSNGGGISYTLTPTFGYLLGFVFGAYIVGSFCIQKTPTWHLLFLCALLGLFVIYLFGGLYYWLIQRVYLNTNLAVSSFLIYCILLPLPGDVLSAAAAAYLAKRLKAVC